MTLFFQWYHHHPCPFRCHPDSVMVGIGWNCGECIPRRQPLLSGDIYGTASPRSTMCCRMEKRKERPELLTYARGEWEMIVTGFSWGECCCCQSLSRCQSETTFSQAAAVREIQCSGGKVCCCKRSLIQSPEMSLMPQGHQRAGRGFLIDYIVVRGHWPWPPEPLLKRHSLRTNALYHGITIDLSVAKQDSGPPMFNITLDSRKAFEEAQGPFSF